MSDVDAIKELKDAAGQGNIIDVQALMAHKDLTGKHIGQGLIEASYKGHNNLVKFFLDLNKEFITSKKIGEALVAGALGGHLDLVKIFLDLKGRRALSRHY